MNKRQTKKKEKREILKAFQAVFEDCQVSEDPIATLDQIKSEGVQYFKKKGINMPPEGFEECLSQCEEVIRDICSNE